jgi:hypothetical protein
MSQKPIWDAMYELHFGLHDNTGIHGACPWEVMHGWVQLNMFKYLSESFFLQTGEESILSNKLDSCVTIGKLLKRQSDRDMQQTMFKTGVRVGMLQARHMIGVMIVLSLCIHSTQGRELLLCTSIGKQKQYFNSREAVRNWSCLLETHLMFHSWLMQPTFQANLVVRAIEKVMEVLAMTTAVGQRQKGIGDNRSTFHGAMHVPESILNFGAPRHVNTECNKSHHKDDKGTAMNIRDGHS